MSVGGDSFQYSCHLRSDFVASDDEGHFAAPGVDEAGPTGVQGDVVAILAAKAHGRVLERRLSSILQDWIGGSRENLIKRVGELASKTRTNYRKLKLCTRWISS